MSRENSSILSQLEELAYKFGIDIRYEDLCYEDFMSKGGLCRIKDKTYIIVNQKESMEKQVKTIAKALGKFDLEAVYMRPALREFITHESKAQ